MKKFFLLFLSVLFCCSSITGCTESADDSKSVASDVKEAEQQLTPKDLYRNKSKDYFKEDDVPATSNNF